MEKECVICCLAKNEKDYIKEWIDYHLELGFDKIIIGDNNDIDGETYEEMLYDYIKENKVIIANLRGKKGYQIEFYNFIKKNYDYEWCAFIDIDEFLTFTPEFDKIFNHNIKKFLETNENIKNYHVNWVMYGDNSLIYKTSSSVLERFVEPCKKQTRKYIKTIAHKSVDKDFAGCPHHIHDYIAHSPNGEVCSNSSISSKMETSVLYIRHFYTKSLEEWLYNKMSKGSDVRNGRSDYYTIDMYKFYNDWNGEKEELYQQFLEDTTKTLVTVIIPCYNYSSYIKDAINSVKQQTLKGFECIIVNDGSTDNSDEIIKKEINDDSRFIYIYNSVNKGCSKCLNQALAIAKGKYIVRLDADDMLVSDYLQRGVYYLSQNKEAILYYTSCVCFGDGGVYTLHYQYLDYLHNLDENQIPCYAMFNRRDVMKIYGFKENIKGYEDWDLWTRLLYDNNKKVIYDKTFGYLYRRHENSKLLKDNEKARENIKEIVDANKMIYEEMLLNNENFSNSKSI